MKEKKMIPISRDGNRIARMCKDLETYCGFLNEMITKFKNQGLFTGEITESQVKELAMLNADSIKAEIKASYELEAADITIPFKRQQFLDGLFDVYQAIEIIFDEMRETLRKNVFKFYFKESPYDLVSGLRVPYITIKNGKIVYDKQKVEDDNTIYASGDYFQDFIKRAKALYQQMVDFDNEVRLLSNAKGHLIYGIGYGDNEYFNSLITIGGKGTIILDWRELKNLEFENADEILKNGNYINNSEIMGENIIKEIESSTNKKG